MIERLAQVALAIICIGILWATLGLAAFAAGAAGDFWDGVKGFFAVILYTATLFGIVAMAFILLNWIFTGRIGV